MKKIYDIWFSSLDIKNSSKLALLDKYNTKEIWNLDFTTLVEHIDEKDIVKILNYKNLDDSKRMLEYMESKDIKLISIKDNRYPSKLNNIDDKPAFIYVRGNEKILEYDAVRNSRLQNG